MAPSCSPASAWPPWPAPGCAASASRRNWCSRTRSTPSTPGSPSAAPWPSRWLDKRPSELSGGQLQRVVLARALVVRPLFLIADEPVSMLDVSVRAGILNLMRELRDRLGLTAPYISHDLTLVRYVCERTLVMYLGRIVEDGPTAAVIARPAHPCTQALIQAVPRPHTDQPRGALPIHGGLGDPAHPPSGCRLRDRCPYAFDRCAAETPRLAEVAPGHRAACHLVAG